MKLIRHSRLDMPHEREDSYLIQQANDLMDHFFEMAGDTDTNYLIQIGSWWRLEVIARHYCDEVSLSEEELFLLREGGKLICLSQGKPNLPEDKIQWVNQAINANQYEIDIGLGLCCCCFITGHLCDENEAIILLRIASERFAYAIAKPDSPEQAEKYALSALGKKGAQATHSKPGGSREKQQRIRDAWARGKYSSRDICAEQECAAIGMSFSTARKALRNTPNPT